MKLDRARLHLEFLDQAVAEFAGRIESRDAYRVAIDYESEAGKHVFRLRVLLAPPSIPWGIMAGDAIHNMRSALDQLIELMTIRHTGCPLAHTGFPIFDDPAKFRDSGRSMIRGVSPAVRKAITDMQPYHRDDPTTDPLWELHDLWNMDKHRVIPLIGIVAVGKTFSDLRVNGPLNIPDDVEDRIPFVDGAEIARMLLTNPDDPEVDVELNPHVDVIFEHSGKAAFGVFADAHNAVMDTIVRLNSL